MKNSFNKKSHKFETEQHKKDKTARIWIISIVAFVLIFGTISLLILLKNYDYNLSNIVKDETSTSETESQTEIVNAEGEADILLAVYDGEKLKYVGLLNADASSRAFTIDSLDESSKVDSKTLSQIFSSAEEKERMEKLKTAVSKLTHTNIDRYVGASYNEFTRCINTMGSVVMTIPKDISYEDDEIMLSLKAGEWKLTGPNLLNYLLISKEDVQNEIISSILREYLTPENVENGESIFRKLINVVDSDITAFDFNSALSALKAFTTGEKFTVNGG